MSKKVLVTGGAGFIGSHLSEQILGPDAAPEWDLWVLDKLTYAGSLENLSGIGYCPYDIVPQNEKTGHKPE